MALLLITNVTWKTSSHPSLDVSILQRFHCRDAKAMCSDIFKSVFKAFARISTHYQFIENFMQRKTSWMSSNKSFLGKFSQINILRDSLKWLILIEKSSKGLFRKDVLRGESKYPKNSLKYFLAIKIKLKMRKEEATISNLISIVSTWNDLQL